jgi:anti-sigma-K factor RskA
MARILSADDAQLLSLENRGGGGDSTMKAAVSRSQDRMLMVSDNLASPPEGKTYQLWTLVDESPRSMGLLEPSDGAIAMEVSGLGDAEAVAISVEPDGGSRTPTDVVMVGALPPVA